MNKYEKYEKLAEECSGSYWNYRWIKNVTMLPKLDENLNDIPGEFEEEIDYELHEVYYDKDEKPFMWTENSVRINVFNVDDMFTLINKLLNTSMEKVLTIKDNKIIELDEYIDGYEKIKNYLKEGNNE